MLEKYQEYQESTKQLDRIKPSDLMDEFVSTIDERMKQYPGMIKDGLIDRKAALNRTYKMMQAYCIFYRGLNRMPEPKQGELFANAKSQNDEN